MKNLLKSIAIIALILCLGVGVSQGINSPFSNPPPAYVMGGAGVSLQSATPGTQQTGHINISGTMMAATFIGPLTGNASSATLWGAYAAIAGPTQARTYTFPDAAATILTTNAAVTAPQGGTGQTVYAVGDLLYAPTTTTIGPIAAVVAGQVLVSAGVNTAPVYSAAPSLTGVLTALGLATSSTATSGTILAMSAPNAVVLGGALTGQSINLSTNYTATGFSVTGQTTTLPAVTNVGAGTYAYKGNVVTGGSLVQTTLAGTNTWSGLDITMPNTTQTTGSVIATGLKITGGTVTSGTAYALTTTASAGNVGIGATGPSNKLQVYDATAQPQALFNGYSMVSAAAAVYNGSIQLGNNASYNARIDFNNTVTPILSIDNSYDDANAVTQFRFRTIGTPVTTMTLVSSGNVGIGTATFGTSAVTVLGMALATAPTTAPANMAQLWVKDLGAGGTAGFQFMNEAAITVYTMMGCSGVVANSTGAATILDIGAAPTVNTGWMTVNDNTGTPRRIPYW